MPYLPGGGSRLTPTEGHQRTYQLKALPALHSPWGTQICAVLQACFHDLSKSPLGPQCPLCERKRLDSFSSITILPQICQQMCAAGLLCALRSCEQAGASPGSSAPLRQKERRTTPQGPAPALCGFWGIPRGRVTSTSAQVSSQTKLDPKLHSTPSLPTQASCSSASPAPGACPPGPHTPAPPTSAPGAPGRSCPWGRTQNPCSAVLPPLGSQPPWARPEGAHHHLPGLREGGRGVPGLCEGSVLKVLGGRMSLTVKGSGTERF